MRIKSIFSRNIRAIPRPELNQDELRFLPALIEIEETAPAVLPRFVIIAISAFMLTAITWASLGKIDVYAVAPGKVIPEGKLQTIQPADPGIISAIHIREGQHVKAGDILVELNPIGNAAEVKSIAERKAMLLTEISRLEAEISGSGIKRIPNASDEQLKSQEILKLARDSAYEAKWSEANNDYNAKLLAHKSAVDTLTKMELVVKSTQEREEKVRPHVGIVMARFNYLTLLDNLTQGKTDVTNQKNTVQEAEQQVKASQSRIAQIVEGRRTSNLAEIAEKKRALIALAAEEQKQSSLFSQRTLRAPANGEIQTLTVNGSGAVVAAGQAIATLVPEGSPLIVEAFVSNEDIGHIKVGQTVDVKVDTFPSQKFGTIPAVITQISVDAEEKGLTPSENVAQQKGVNYLPTKAGLAYRVKIKLLTAGIIKEGRTFYVKAGMTVQADIKTDNRKIISFLFDPISKVAETAISVR